MTTDTDGTDITITTRHGHVDIHCYYDDRDPRTAGWYAAYHVYVDDDTDVTQTDDSAKVWHPDMPRRANAERKAQRIARVYARQLLRTCS